MICMAIGRIKLGIKVRQTSLHHLTLLLAPLYKYTPDNRTNYTTNYEWILDTWLDLGANPAKMSLGLPSYGQTFKLKNPLTDHGLLAEAEGPNDKVCSA